MGGTAAPALSLLCRRVIHSSGTHAVYSAPLEQSLCKHHGREGSRETPSPAAVTAAGSLVPVQVHPWVPPGDGAAGFGIWGCARAGIQPLGVNCQAWGGLSGSGMVPKREFWNLIAKEGIKGMLARNVPGEGQHPQAPPRLLGHFLGGHAAPRGGDNVLSPPRDAVTASSSTKSQGQPPSPCCLPGRGNSGTLSVFPHPPAPQIVQLMVLCLIKW